MRKINTAKQNHIDYKTQLLQQANNVTELFKDSEYAADFEDEIIPQTRTEVSPPVTPEKTRFNPDQIVDIVTFIEHPFFCNLKPHPWQRLILKCFYMGQEGNTNIFFNDVPQEERTSCIENSPCLICNKLPDDVKQERYRVAKEEATNPDAERIINELSQRPIIENYQCERDLFFAEELDQKVRKQILDKCEKRFKFQELVLVLGRRSGKSFLVSAIALYELYRLIAMGHPQARYGLMEFDQITLLNVAKNEEQAKNAIFAKIKNTVLSSPFFQPYIGKDNELEMRFYTENDRRENDRRINQGMNPFSGSLVLKCGSSSASGLVGLTCWCIIMDEIAAMAGDSPDSGVDYALYNDLKPSLATFGRDGKIMMLSNPKGPLGLLYDLHENRLDDPSTLIMRMPTWLSNPNIDKEYLEGEKKKNPVEFQMQYGAEFGAASSDPMFSPDDILIIML